MAKLLNWLAVAGKLKEKGVLIFSTQDIAVIFGATGTAVNFFVHRNAKKGLLVRLKKSKKESLHALANDMPDEYLTAKNTYRSLSENKKAPGDLCGIYPRALGEFISRPVSVIPAKAGISFSFTGSPPSRG